MSNGTACCFRAQGWEAEVREAVCSNSALPVRERREAIPNDGGSHDAVCDLRCAAVTRTS